MRIGKMGGMTDITQRLIELAIQIQQIPAPTFYEQQRAEFVRRLFVEHGLSDVSMDEVGNVYGRWSSGSNLYRQPLIISAHLDTVFPLEMDLSLRREAGKVFGIGIGDNSIGVAALFGLLWMLRERHFIPARDIWLVANTGEEGLGDLRGMKAVVERFGADVLAYLVIEGLALGHVYHRAVGVRRYRISAQTQGGHAWSDFGQPSAIVELAKLVVQLSAVQVPQTPRTTINVGKIQGGTSINTIAAEAWLELDLRSEGQAELSALVRRVEKLIEAASRPGVRIAAEVIGSRPAGTLPAEHPLVRLAQRCLIEQGVEAVLTAGSTDANVPLSRGFPALVLGVTQGGGAHTKYEFIETEPIRLGMEQLARFVSAASGER